MERSELDVLMEQVEELLGGGIVDADEAIELASLAGMAERLGGRGAVLDEVAAWRADGGQEMLDEGWSEVDVDALVEAIDELSGGDASALELEEAVFDFDELVVAAVWCGQKARVRAAARKVEALVRLVPDVFADMAPYGAALAGLASVAEHLDVYGYWLAITDAAAYADEQD
jgi:hypothetical protein